MHTVLDTSAATPSVVTVGSLADASLARLLAAYGLEIVAVGPGRPIPASFWGDEEAGRESGRVYLRDDTPVHSALHEAGHHVCMTPARRRSGRVDAGGDHGEENAVCYWQILAADHVTGMDRARMCADMDAWGYTFRLGSAAAWFEHDAADARAWLIANDLVTPDADSLSFRLRR